MQPLNTLPKYNMFGVEDIDYKKSKVVILPIPYDATVTYKSGTRDGPRAIIEASRNMELYSYELGADISGLGFYTMDEMAPDLSSPENMARRIAREVELILSEGKLPLLLGGEHTLTIGAVQGVARKKKNFSVVQLDAHADGRDEMFNSRYMHATVMARVGEIAKSSASVGIRSTHAKSQSKNTKTYFMGEVHSKGISAIAKDVAKHTEKEIYLTIDLDVLDPSEMPSVGTPEPDGLRFGELCRFVEELAKSKKLIGLDIVELSPIPQLHAPNYLAAKLAYLAVGYFIGSGKGSRA
ncbi:MAG: agmatinase [Candidatus Micrarchaeota archaeon]|nr:agmatinase [Candidatus Micrarchaeota archaeon]MDE1864991.1 agmatinase [Candidatus Micrarchaeota archaeon]